MTATPANPYLQTKVNTASPVELRLMLFDGAVKFLQQGIDGLERKDYEASYNGISRCQNIVMELMNALRPDQSPDLCEKLSALYTFMYTRLVEACTERDAEKAREVLKLLHYERQTWVMLMDQLASENAAAADVPAALPQAEPTVQGGTNGERTNGLVGGTISFEG
jgi:flagellar protein FliS